MHLQPLYDIAELCAKKGIVEAILCPGSRCAPLIIAFAEHPAIHARTINDERSAAYIACGMSASNNMPTVLISTSGSAPYNFAPAVSESFFQGIPLLIITADRPKEWVGQRDGQAIVQQNIYGENIKKYYELPQDYVHPDALWHINRTVNEAINMTMQQPLGPVHINIPIREPLYSAKKEKIRFSKNVRIIETPKTESRLSPKSIDTLTNQFLSSPSILMLIGQHEPSTNLQSELTLITKHHSIPIITEISSTQHGLSKKITHAGSLLDHSTVSLKKKLRPKLLITLGKAVLSKSLKQFIRQYPPAQHWHVEEQLNLTDTYQSLTHHIHVEPAYFLKKLRLAKPSSSNLHVERTAYAQPWHQEDLRIEKRIHSFFVHAQHNEFSLVYHVLNRLPHPCNLHLANSLSIRYANTIGLPSTKPYIRVRANRGVCGIDGSTSTAVGNALIDTQNLTVLITGDIAFFYDRNAFWHQYPMPNLRIVLLNNHGGGIFSTISGPERLAHITDRFTSPQSLNAKTIAEDYDFDYLPVTSEQDIKRTLDDFFIVDGKPKLLELETDQNTVKKTMNLFASHLNKKS